MVDEEGEPVNIEGRDASYEETMARVAEMLEAEKIDRERIASMSQESAREFLNEAIIKISKALGIAMSKTAAMVADVLQMGKNAAKAFSEGIREGYQQARRVRPYGE
jgi:hypothetical protein